jgi:hypothetical protein
MNSRSDAWLAVTSAHIPHYGHIAVIVGTLYPEDHRVSVRGDRSRMVRRVPTARSFKATHMRCLTSTAAPISSTQHEICSSAKGIAASAAVGYVYKSSLSPDAIRDTGRGDHYNADPFTILC